MRLIRRISRNLRASILATFTVLLLFSFLLAGVAVNFAARQYIHVSARNALSDALDAHWIALPVDATSEGFINHVLARGNEINIFHNNLRHFAVDADFQLWTADVTTPVKYTAMRDITGFLEAQDMSMRHIPPQRIRVSGNVYYIASLASMTSPPHLYMIYYVDVMDLQRFTTTVNFRLLFFVVAIWMAAMAVSTVLAGNLAQPIKNLSKFAKQIGKGDFTPNPVTYINEEFEELNASLNHAAMQLAKYDNDQKAFFQNVSHELRTPLMSIKSYAEGIKYGVMDPIKASETILECTDRLTEMVGDVLYVSRIDNITPPTMEEVNFVALAEERISGQKAQAEAKGLTISFKSDGEPILISCVKSYIERAVDNLISNAIRYATSTITIECYAIGSKVTIRVLDDGPGFEPDALPAVFERFYKGKNGLTGIGLAIVKSVVEQHKGTATAENGESGAILTISLPRMTP